MGALPSYMWTAHQHCHHSNPGHSHLPAFVPQSKGDPGWQPCGALQASTSQAWLANEAGLNISSDASISHNTIKRAGLTRKGSRYEFCGTHILD